MKFVSLVLGLMTVSASAAPMQYVFNFIGGSPNPTGSFTYDSAALSNPFSNFTVTWSGATVNFTGAANAGSGVTGACDTSAANSTDFFNGLNGGCGPQQWVIVRQSSFIAVILGGGASFFVQAGGGPSVGPDTDTGGAFTIAPVPEPSSLLLMSAGGALLFAFRRRRAARIDQPKR